MLFFENGITISSILTVIRMAIFTLMLTLTGAGSSGGPTPMPPALSDKGKFKELVKEYWQSLRHALVKLTYKAATALLMIIDSIVSWLLSLLGKMVETCGYWFWLLGACSCLNVVDHEEATVPVSLPQTYPQWGTPFHLHVITALCLTAWPTFSYLHYVTCFDVWQHLISFS